MQSPRVSPDNVPSYSSLLPPTQNGQIQRNASALTGADVHVSASMSCHLIFDPDSLPGVASL